MENKKDTIVKYWNAVPKNKEFGKGPMANKTDKAGVLYYITDSHHEIPNFMDFENFEKFLTKSFEQKKKDLIEERKLRNAIKGKDSLSLFLSNLVGKDNSIELLEKQKEDSLLLLKNQMKKFKNDRPKNRI